MSVSSQGEIVLPRWQPDDELSNCSVCGQPFSFLNRRHHCRRCGRLVCASCSPHRITIPRQYIVRPPDPFIALYQEGTRHAHEHSSSEFGDNPALGGGETVRVCNPCVPDPNPGPPPQYSQQPSPALPPSRAGLPHPAQTHAQPQAAVSRPRNMTASRYGEQRTPYTPQPDQSQSAPHQNNAMSTASYLQARRLRQEPAYVPRPAQRSRENDADHVRRLAQLPPIGSGPRPNDAATAAWSHPDHPLNTGPLPGENDRDFMARFASWSTPPSASEDTSGEDGQIGSRPTPSPRPPPSTMPTRRPHRHSEAAILRTTSDQPPVSRRDEENECPVCGTREPPFTSDGTSEARERHVMSCLENHFGFAGPSTGSPSQAVAQPSRPAADPSAARAAPSASSLQASSSSQPTPAAPQGRPRAHTNRQRMLVYHATEKDCFNENGEPQECIICFEEFQPGDEMGRLECLCKFHRACIRGWWDTKGYGTCPTHQLHD